MATESDKTVTTNRPHKATWERYYPESFDISLVQSLVNLKTYWGTYLSALADGSLKAEASQVSEMSQW